MHRSIHCRPSAKSPSRLTASKEFGRLFAVRRSLVLFIALATSLALGVSAVKPAVAHAQQGRNPAWTSFTAELNGNNVRDILVDRNGSVWFATRRGVYTFDGAWHDLTTAAGLKSSNVYALAETPDGAIWLGTAEGLIQVSYDPLTGTRSFAAQKEAVGPIWALQAGPDETLWVSSEQGVGYLAQNGWHAVAFDGAAPPPERVYAIAVDGRGTVWLGGAKLYRYDPVQNHLQVDTSLTTNSLIKALLVTPATSNWPETLWVGTQGDGLWAYNQQEWVHFAQPLDAEPVEGIASDEVLALAEDGEGNLWIGTNGRGISLFNRDGLSPFWSNGYWRTLTTIDGLSANAVGAIAVGHDGLIWVGTISGADRLDSRSWRVLSSPDLPAGLDVVTALVDSTGVLWIAAEGSGLIRYDGRALQRLTQANASLPEDFVRTLTEDEHGYLWIGTASRGLFKAPLIGRPSIAELQPEDWVKLDTGLPDDTPWRASVRAADGSLWFGTYNSGVVHFAHGSEAGQSAERWEVFTTGDGLPSNEINQDALLQDSDGAIWVGTPAGLSCFGPQERVWQTFTTADGLDDDNILSLAEVPSSQPGAGLWVGSRAGGLHHRQTTSARWERVLSANAPINALVAAPTSGLWLGGPSGLLRFDPATGLRRTYTRSDGLVDNEISELTVGPTGEVWIGTKLGISRHMPYTGRPRVEIMTVNGQKPSNGVVTVLAGEPVVITFRGYDLLTPQNAVSYRARIEGVDETWRVTEQSQLTYRDLAPGQFTFQVAAFNAALNLSEPPAKVVLQVAPSVVLPVLGRLSTYTATSLLALLVMALGGSAGVLFLSVRNRRRRREALKRRFNPYVSGDPIQNSDMFYGRQDIQARIVNMLHENSIMIHGERRIGKTSLLYQIADQLRKAADPDFLFIPVYVDMEGTPQEELFHLLMEEILRVAPSYVSSLPPLRFNSIPKSDYSDRDFSYDMGDLLDALSAASKREVRLILLLDEMDVINDYDPVVQQQLRRIFMRTYARNLGAVVAGIQINKEWDRVESPWYNLFNEIELGPLDEHEARRLILEPVKGIYSYEDAAVDTIIAASQGRPYYIQQHCLEAVNIMLAAGRTRVTKRDAEDALKLLINARTSQNSGLQSPQHADVTR